ncbi:MAG: hypothetical protein AABX44_00125 [Nanoarchaeota archaeon]
MKQILETKLSNGQLFWENEKPKLNLTPLEKTVVEMLTQKEYDELMQVYEAGGWKWRSRDLPTFYNYFTKNKEKIIFVDAGISYSQDLKEFFEYRYEKLVNYETISVERFYEIQKITQKDLIELNEYFKGNFPNRASKGE